MSVVDPALMAHLEIEENVPGVWHVKLPRWPWQYARAETERDALVERMTAHAPIRRLWLSDSADDTHGQWQALAADQPLSDMGSGLAYGDWLLLFFERDPEPGALAPAPAYPKAPADALAKVAEYGATAAIWSWLDDAEWLVVVRPCDSPPSDVDPRR